jgi:putative Ig domain-containing protein
VAGSSARAATINVPANGSLQTAVNNAQPGDTIALEAGATDTGNFRLPVKNGAMLITIRTAGDADLPGEGGRISPAHAPLLAKIRSGGTAPAFETAIGVRHTAAGIQILGYDNNHPSQQTRDIVVRNNLFADIDSTSWGGNGYFRSLTPWRSAATDGRDLGAPLDGAIGGASANCESATCGVVLIVGTELPSGVVGSPYAGSLTVRGDVGPYSWSIDSGSLPAGLGFDEFSRTIAGQPRAASAFSLRIAVKDSCSTIVQTTANVTVVVTSKQAGTRLYR